ncbi:MAG: CRISPR system precrRNA processing endoribonuclease RAMP protein Cas6 [Candidatus Caenarcaniphilales bacterium]|nr:CRISPR system precrRNA processing endoribonuclease RAMP protein Cas6 [Candidatus Caenarcaniphilales bacterium]
MLGRLKLLYRSEHAERLKTLKYDIGGVVHNFLIAELFARKPELFEIAHQSGSELKPFALSWPKADLDNGFISWEITSLNAEAYSFLEDLAAKPADSYKIDRAEDIITLQKSSLEEGLSYADFTVRYFASPSDEIPDELELEFAAPTTFNWSNNGHYYPLPDLELLYVSALRKWKYFASDISLEDGDLLPKLVNNTRYNYVRVLHQTVKIAGARIPCFHGSIKVKLYGADSIKRLTHLILRYLEYSGTGAKTQMGLGKTRVIPLSRNKQDE